MLIDANDLILQYSLIVTGFWILIAVARHIMLLRAQPRRTAEGMPERRRRPRLVLPDPATLRPCAVAPGEMI